MELSVREKEKRELSRWFVMETAEEKKDRKVKTKLEERGRNGQSTKEARWRRLEQLTVVCHDFFHGNMINVCVFAQKTFISSFWKGSAEHIFFRKKTSATNRWILAHRWFGRECETPLGGGWWQRCNTLGEEKNATYAHSGAPEREREGKERRRSDEEDWQTTHGRSEELFRTLEDSIRLEEKDRWSRVHERHDDASSRGDENTTK